MRHSLTSSHSFFMSPSVRYLHFLACSSHWSGPPAVAAAGPPPPPFSAGFMVLGGAGEGGGEEGVRLWDEGEEEEDGDGGVGAGGVRVRKGRSWLMSGMVAGFGGGGLGVVGSRTGMGVRMGGGCVSAM